MSPDEAKQNIEGIYAKHKGKLNALKKEQDKIIADFIAALEKAKIEEVKNNLRASLYE